MVHGFTTSFDQFETFAVSEIAKQPQTNDTLEPFTPKFWSNRELRNSMMARYESFTSVFDTPLEGCSQDLCFSCRRSGRIANLKKINYNENIPKEVKHSQKLRHPKKSNACSSNTNRTKAIRTLFKKPIMQTPEKIHTFNGRSRNRPNKKKKVDQNTTNEALEATEQSHDDFMEVSDETHQKPFNFEARNEGSEDYQMMEILNESRQYLEKTLLKDTEPEQVICKEASEEKDQPLDLSIMEISEETSKIGVRNHQSIISEEDEDLSDEDLTIMENAFENTADTVENEVIEETFMDNSENLEDDCNKRPDDVEFEFSQAYNRAYQQEFIEVIHQYNYPFPNYQYPRPTNNLSFLSECYGEFRIPPILNPPPHWNQLYFQSNSQIGQTSENSSPPYQGYSQNNNSELTNNNNQWQIVSTQNFGQTSSEQRDNRQLFENASCNIQVLPQNIDQNQSESQIVQRFYQIPTQNIQHQQLQPQNNLEQGPLPLSQIAHFVKNNCHIHDVKFGKIKTLNGRLYRTGSLFITFGDHYKVQVIGDLILNNNNDNIAFDAFFRPRNQF